MNFKQIVQSFVPGWTGKLAVHHVGYNADGHVHRGLPYSTAHNANDPAVIAIQIAMMQAAGFDAVIHTWQGAYASACNANAIAMAAACAKVGMEFMFLLDPWCAKLNGKGSDTNYTKNVTSSLQASSTQAILTGSSYVPEKYVLDFKTGADLTALGKTFPTLKFLAQGSGFSWITIPSITESVARNAASVAKLKTQNADPAMKVPGICFSFNDAGCPQPQGVQSQSTFDAAGGVRKWDESVWNPDPVNCRVMDSFSGQFAIQQLGVTPKTAPYVAVETWDDYDELSSGPLEKVLSELWGVNWAALSFTPPVIGPPPPPPNPTAMSGSVAVAGKAYPFTGTF